jgi:hypothetical protein
MKQKPDLSDLHVFGCRLYPQIKSISHKEKLEPRAHLGYLVGYDATNIYRILVPSVEKVIRTRDVTFNKTQLYDPVSSLHPSVIAITPCHRDTPPVVAIPRPPSACNLIGSSPPAISCCGTGTEDDKNEDSNEKPQTKPTTNLPTLSR